MHSPIDRFEEEQRYSKPFSLSVGYEDKGDFVDKDGLFADDNGSVLCMLCGDYFDLPEYIKGEGVEVGEEMPGLEPVPGLEDMVIVTGSDPVRIGSSLSDGSQAGRVNRAALAITSMGLDSSSSDHSSVESGVEIASL